MDRLPDSVRAELPPWEDVSKLLPLLSVDTDGPGIERLSGGRGETTAALLAVAKRHLAPRAIPVEAGILGADPPLLSAMIDVSDGIARDLRNLCRASGVGANIREELLPVPKAFSLLLGDGMDLRPEYVLSSGEEYVMLAACSGEPPQGTVIGEIVSAGEGLTFVGRDGQRRGLPDAGYEHAF
jgi:thiamine-monophosphate kinase